MTAPLRHHPWPDDPTLTALVAAFLQGEGDDALRLVLADRLEDRGDPRAALVRLVPALLATPRREGLRPDVPAEVRWGRPGRPPFSGYTTTRADWPALGALHQGGYARCHSLGRLFLTAAVLEWVREPHPDSGLIGEFGRPGACLRYLDACWLYSCWLVGHRERDRGWWWVANNSGRFHCGLADRLCEWLGCRSRALGLALASCRAGPFGALITRLETMLAWGGPCVRVDAPDDLTAEQALVRLRWQAAFWSRWLDLRDAFAALWPWAEARRVMGEVVLGMREGRKP